MSSESQPGVDRRFDFVFLDRDGVINRKLPEGRYVTCWDEFELLPGVPEAIAALNRAGCKVIVVTNQRGIDLGLMLEGALAEIHRRLQAELASRGAVIDAIYYCPHGRDGCTCRKPRPGMIERAFREFPGASAANSILIGDSLSDIELGRRARLATIFIAGEGAEDDADRRADGNIAAAQADGVARSLPEAVTLLLQENAGPSSAFCRRVNGGGDLTARTRSK